MRSHLNVLACLATLGAATAQSTTNVVVPAAYANAEADGAALWLASPFAARRQLLIDARHLVGHAGEEIVAITVRRNAGVLEALEGGRLQVDIAMSNNAVLPRQSTARFATNRGPDHRTVLARTVSFPFAPPATQRPVPWNGSDAITLGLTEPFVYTGRTLVIETLTTLPNGNSRGPLDLPWWPLDAVVLDAGGQTTTTGRSCIAAMPDEPAGAEPASLIPGATALFYLHGGGHSGLGLLTLGTLPLDVDLTPIGAPGCRLRNDWLLLELAAIERVGPYGQARVAVALPADPGLLGATLLAQWIVADPGINALGLTVSNGVRATLGSPSDLGIAWIENTDQQAGEGTILLHRAPVLRITFRRP